MSEDNIKLVHMQQSGPIPGLVGWFSGGQTVTINMDTMEVVSQVPLAQRAYDASPLVEPASTETATETVTVVGKDSNGNEVTVTVPAPEPVQTEPAPIETPPEPTTEQVVDVTPASQEGVV